MNKKKCPLCQSTRTKRNGTRKGVQLYKCQACGRQFRAGEKLSSEQLWNQYQDHKQTVAEIAKTNGVSASTIKRQMALISIDWVQPDLRGKSGYVHIDATYWGRGKGIIVAIDDATGFPLYMEYIASETTSDYLLAVESISSRGYQIKGIILDGKISVFKALSQYPVQMCQFHMKQIIIRKLTRNPRIKASVALLILIDRLRTLTHAEMEKEYANWQAEHALVIKKRSTTKDGTTHYTHRKLRGAMKSVETFLPYLFTYQRVDCSGMPRTNNKIEGVFTDLKKNLNNHSGLSADGRKRFINGFFLALEGNLHINTNGSEPEPTAT